MKEYNVTRYRIPALIISLSLIVGFWAYTIINFGGFNFGIDIRAGMSIMLEVPGVAEEEVIREALGEYSPQVQTVNDEDWRFNVRIADDEDTPDFQQVVSSRVKEILTEEFGAVEVVSEEYIGSGFAARLATQTIWVTLVSLFLILLYVWMRFQLAYAVSAIAAVFHDVFFLLGFVGAFQLEFSTATIAAVLTIIGYSLNDTIVIFDRVRENSRVVKDKSFRELINLSVTQSLSRTLITSATTLLAVVSILILARGSIRIFALNLVVGVVVGTYSSIFVASPVLLMWRRKTDHHRPHSTSDDASRTVLESAEKKIVSAKSHAPEPIKQTAEEIATATLKRSEAKRKKKKKKK